LRAIHAALASGESSRQIAKRFGFTHTIVNRHIREHIGQALAACNIAEPVLEQIRKLNTRTLAILRKAEDDSDPAMALAAIRESRANLQLVARLTGELKSPEPHEETRVVVTYVNRPTIVTGVDADEPVGIGSGNNGSETNA
jgi:transposase-like protein